MPSDVEQRVASDQDAKDAERRFTTKSGYPKSVAFIIGNEFCERFSYYGMRGKKALDFLCRARLANLEPSSRGVQRKSFPEAVPQSPTIYTIRGWRARAISSRGRVLSVSL